MCGGLLDNAAELRHRNGVTELREVRIDRFDADLYLRTLDHARELVRELQIIEIGEESGTANSTPLELRKLMSEILDRYSGITDANVEVARRALDDGEVEITLVMHLPPDAADDAERFLALLEAADRWCEDGHLLTLAAPPELHAFRQRYIGEVVRQLRQAEPTAT